MKDLSLTDNVLDIISLLTCKSSLYTVIMSPLLVYVHPVCFSVFFHLLYDVVD